MPFLAPVLELISGYPIEITYGGEWVYKVFGRKAQHYMQSDFLIAFKKLKVTGL